MGNAASANHLTDLLYLTPSYLIRGKAMFELQSLSRVGMERCKTARCAIKVMGEAAVKYGFYGCEATGPAAAMEAGETLTIVDGEEVLPPSLSRRLKYTRSPIALLRLFGRSSAVFYSLPSRLYVAKFSICLLIFVGFLRS
jgi:hypothetical protein